jgi:hypothetical protein
MPRKVVDTNYLQHDGLRDYLSQSRDSVAIVTPFVELEMLKGEAVVNVLKSTEILAGRPGQVVLTKDPQSVHRLKGRRKAMKKRLSGGRRTSGFRKWCRHTRERAQRGDEQSAKHIMRASEEASAQLADMLENAKTFHENIEDALKRYTKEDLDTFRKGPPFTPALIEKIRDHVMEMAQQFYEAHPDEPGWPPKNDDLFYNYIFRFALCARLHALHVIAGGKPKDPKNLTNDFIDVSVAAYATCFDGLLSNDAMTKDIFEKARFLLDNEFLKVPT